ncbi:DUF805 domain-containing protein [Staphylococcus sp. EZ-P03]|uniref:DUF805 domain-containing protein n=1 Tax=Staphylococcus sp. EZ-P03 TaxID=2282739 RepID=UPI000DF742A9|nr:DUF805 domain-containing protein [Staphylococcus sp. EZ-P03]
MIKRVGFKEAFKRFWKNYVNFKGRATRSEYWYMALWILILYIPAIVLGFFAFIFIITGAIGDSGGIALAGFIFLIIALILYIGLALALFIPSYALLTRRFHDTGRTMVIPIIFFVMSIIINFINYFDSSSAQPSDFTAGSIFYLIFTVIYLGISIYVLVIACLPSKEQDNKYGRSPYIRPNHVPQSESDQAHTRSNTSDL